METLDKGKIHTRVEESGGLLGFHHTTQSNEQFEIFEVFVFGIFHLIVLEHITETLGNEPANMDDCSGWKW